MSSTTPGVLITWSVRLSQFCAPSDSLHSHLRSSVSMSRCSDIPTKQFILHLNSQMVDSFIIKDLDDTHLFVEAHAVNEIR